MALAAILFCLRQQDFLFAVSIGTIFSPENKLLPFLGSRNFENMPVRFGRSAQLAPPKMNFYSESCSKSATARSQHKHPSCNPADQKPFDSKAASCFSKLFTTNLPFSVHNRLNVFFFFFFHFRVYFRTNNVRLN